MAGWSLGWTTGLKLNGVRVLDAAGQPILQLVVAHDRPLPPRRRPRQNYTLGEAVIDGLDFQLRREADGEFNFAKLAKAADAPAADARSPQPAPNRSPRGARRARARSCQT